MMRVIRAYAMGVGTGYLIWSGAGRKLVDKVGAWQRSAAGSDRTPRVASPTEASVLPSDFALAVEVPETVTKATSSSPGRRKAS
jgi:hypothetical protein